jgi:hypothetical protein
MQNRGARRERTESSPLPSDLGAQDPICYSRKIKGCFMLCTPGN